MEQRIKVLKGDELRIVVASDDPIDDVKTCSGGGAVGYGWVIVIVSVVPISVISNRGW